MARLALFTILLACWIAPGESAGQRLQGKPDLIGVSGYYGYATAVGKNGAVYKYDRRKRTWKRQTVSETSTLLRVAMLGRSDIWALAGNGRVLRLRRGRWSLLQGIDKGSYRGFARAGRGRGAVVGNGGAIYHLVRGNWSKFYASPIKKDLYAVARVGRGGNERFIAVGKGGAVIALSGIGRSVLGDMEITKSKQDLVAIAACRGYRAEAVAVGRDVVVRSRRGGTWKNLTTAPWALNGVALRCRRGRVTHVYGVGKKSVLEYNVKTGAWHNHPMPDVDTLRGIAWLDRRRLVVVGDKGSTAIVAIKNLGKTWNLLGMAAAVLPRYPKATKMCSGRVYVRRRGHLSWVRYATSAKREAVKEFFERRLGAKNLQSTKHADTWRHPKAKPTRVLSVQPVGTMVRMPKRCKVPPGTTTIIETSRFPR